VTEIYPAGEDKIPGIDAEQLVDAIRAHGHRHASLVAELDDVVQRLPRELEAGDLVITLGAGSISSVGPRLLDALAEEDA
jgi:UDP-N-acetylmuramate--alanine ligase